MSNSMSNSKCNATTHIQPQSQSECHPFGSFNLDSLGVIRITGEESRKLLQGQSTCNVDLLSQHQGLLGALCNIKGRMYASFYLLESFDNAHTLLMVMNRDIIQSTLENLKKYSLFFKVSLEDASNAFQIVGNIEKNACPDATSEPLQPLKTLLSATKMTLHLPSQAKDAKLSRTLVLNDITTSTSPNEPSSNQTEQNTNHSIAAWRASNIYNGTLLINSDQVESFIPLELNYHHPQLQGVHFDKGCYTGQEIIARLHYRGNSKKQFIAARSALIDPKMLSTTQSSDHINLEQFELELRMDTDNLQSDNAAYKVVGKITAYQLFNNQIFLCALIEKNSLTLMEKIKLHGQLTHAKSSSTDETDQPIEFSLPLTLIQWTELE